MVPLSILAKGCGLASIEARSHLPKVPARCYVLCSELCKAPHGELSSSLNVRRRGILWRDIGPLVLLYLCKKGSAIFFVSFSVPFGSQAHPRRLRSPHFASPHGMDSCALESMMSATLFLMTSVQGPRTLHDLKAIVSQRFGGAASVKSRVSRVVPFSNIEMEFDSTSF